MVSVKYVKNIKNREVGWTPHCQGIYSNKLKVLIVRHQQYIINIIDYSLYSYQPGTNTDTQQTEAIAILGIA